MYYQTYFQQVGKVLEDIFAHEAGSIEQAGRLLYDSLRQDGLLYAFGCGHSHMISEELFYRAGGLAAVCPMFDTSTMLHEAAAKSSMVERTSGYAQHLIARYPIGPRDCLLLVSNSGINPLPIELAELARARGAKVICITSMAYKDKPSRQAEGKHLYQVCDMYIDSHVPMGDACVEVCSDGTKAAPVSTIAVAAIAHAMVLHACELLRGDGIEPRVFRSGNMPGTDDYNAGLIRDYSPRVRSL